MPFRSITEKTNHCKQTNLRRRKSSLANIPWQLTSHSMKNNTICCKRAALYIFQKGSMTVEASVIIPLFLIAMVMLLSIIQVCTVQVTETSALTQKVKSLSMYAYGVSDYYEGNMVDLYYIKTVYLPVKLFPFSGIPLVIRSRAHTWTGRASGEYPSETEPLEELVYVTESGSVYHTHADCTYLNLSIHVVSFDEAMTLRNEYGSKYHSCEKCVGSNTSPSVVYITDQGEKYHSSSRCSGLKRMVRLVKKSETAHRHICSRCAGRN